jgi:hypothetical protein
MPTPVLKMVGLLSLISISFGGSACAADTPKSSGGSPPSKPPTYIVVGDLTGEITKVSADSITIQVNWETPTMPKNGVKPAKNQAQMQAEMARIANAKPTEHYKDYTMGYTVDAQARVKTLPPKLDADGKPKLDANGKPVAYSAAEKQQLKGNATIPGWKADISELKVGQMVLAHVVKVPPSAADKDKPEEMLVRWAYIVGEAGDKKDDGANKKN